MDLRKRLNPTIPLKNQKGVALLVAIFAMMLLLFLAIEVSYDTQVEYVASSQRINRLKSYYAAKSGVELGLLRVLIYKKAVAQFGETLKNAGGMSLLDQIWQFPFTWPPVLPENASSIDKSQVKDIIKESSMDAKFMLTIESEGGKIDINDLSSTSKKIAESTRAQIAQIFQAKIDRDQEFSREYAGFNFDELLNNLTDWIDEDSDGLNGSDESTEYSEINSRFIPPNQPFKTMNEMRMVKGMDDTLFNLLKERVTIYGIKGVNVNYSKKEVLEALDPQFQNDPEIIKLILERRKDPTQGAFKNEEDFISFLESNGINTDNFNSAEIPLYFDPEYNFRIISTGNFANSTREITAIIYDYEGIKDRYMQILDTRDDDANKQGDSPGDTNKDGDQGQTQDPNKKKEAEKKKINVPTGRPSVVYWSEN